MAVIFSLYSNQIRNVMRPQSAFDTHTQLFTIDLSAAVNAGDIVELGVLPFASRFIDAKVLPVGNFNGVTADIGLMSGDVGAATNLDGVTPRTSGNELFAGVSLAAFTPSLIKSDALLIERVELNRGVGVKFSAALPAAAGRSLGLMLQIHQ